MQRGRRQSQQEASLSLERQCLRPPCTHQKDTALAPPPPMTSSRPQRRSMRPAPSGPPQLTKHTRSNAPTAKSLPCLLCKARPLSLHLFLPQRFGQQILVLSQASAWVSPASLGPPSPCGAELRPLCLQELPDSGHLKQGPGRVCWEHGQ